MAYHDEEWGTPVHDDRVHFEFIVLEGFQAGISWNLVLKKRENFRKAFDNFDPTKIAKYSENYVERLMKDKSIIRNRMKIKSTINNAKKFLVIQEEFGSFDVYVWNFVRGEPIKNNLKSFDKMPVKTELSETLSEDLKKRGFKFVGPVICYSYMQAVGLVNDHLVHCFRYNEL
jgi:DNA-3-methyladenine glycosylase I